MTARGKSARTKGHAFEREVARYLSIVSGDDVRTARSLSGGMQYGADLLTVREDGSVIPHWRGWSIEAKAVAKPSVPSWLEQANRDDVLYPGVVVEKVANKPVAQANVHIARDDMKFLLGFEMHGGAFYQTLPLSIFTALAMQRVSS